MPRYLETAEKARILVDQILATVEKDARPELAAQLAKLYNLGIRTSPRACQSTVRINAVRAAMKTAPVKVSSSQVPIEGRPEKSFVALQVTPVHETKAYPTETEGDSDDE